MFEVKGEWQGYFQENLARFVETSEGKKWLQNLAYLEDSFSHIGKREKSLQGLRENVFTSSGNILGERNHVAKGNLDTFPLCLGLQERKNLGLPQVLSETT